MSSDEFALRVLLPGCMSLFFILWAVLAIWAMKRKEKILNNKVISFFNSSSEGSDLVESFKSAFSTELIDFGNKQEIEKFIDYIINKFLIGKFECNSNDRKVYIEKLNSIKNVLKEERDYSNEKLSVLLSKLDDLDLKNEVNLLFSCMNNYYEGRIFEKDTTIVNKNEEIKKIKKSKFFWNVIALIGFVLTLISTIYSFIKE